MKRIFLALLAIALFSATALADNSSNYQINESFIGNGGLNTQNSSSYQAQDSVGATAVGPAASTSGKQVQTGSQTTDDPALSFAVNTSSLSLGDLSISTAATATATFSVINYTSYGYVVQALGSPPTYSGHSLSNLSSPTASSPGTEQFGINLVANSSPSVGAAASGGEGTAATNYGTTNMFTYNSGDTIAQATKSSAQTNFTISYLANTSSKTPAGTYSGTQTLVCVGTY